jgi:hypothetical protein
MNIINKLKNKLTNKMIVQKYIVEGYEDYMHLMGHFKHYEIFVPEHKMVIRLNNHEVVFVGESDKPHNVYNIGLHSDKTVAEIEEISIDNKFIEGCLEILELTKKTNQMKENLYKYFDDTKSEEERYKDKYKYYVDKFHEIIYEDKEKALEIFKEHLENNVKPDNAGIYLSVARIYKKKENEELFKKYIEKYNQIEKEN